MFSEKNPELFKSFRPASFAEEADSSFLGAWMQMMEGIVADFRLQLQGLRSENQRLRQRNEILEQPFQRSAQAIEKARQVEEKIFEVTLENLELKERLEKIEAENRVLRCFNQEIRNLAGQNATSFEQIKDQVAQFRNFIFQWFSLDEKAPRHEQEARMREQMRSMILKSAYEEEPARQKSS